MNDQVIECHGLSRSFGARQAVSNLEFSVSGGSVFGFLGPNGAGKTTTVRMLLGMLVIYVLFATAVVVAQTAPDMVLHERLGHTLDYLLTTRLPDYSIFGAKVLVSSAAGYVAAMLALAIQLIASALFGGSGWHWLFLALPVGRIIAFGISAELSLYVAVIGTFVALRVGEQRAAYMITIFAAILLTVPFLVGWVHLSLTVQWTTRAAIIFGVFAILLGLVGLRLFRRDMLASYLQE